MLTVYTLRCRNWSEKLLSFRNILNGENDERWWNINSFTTSISAKNINFTKRTHFLIIGNWIAYSWSYMTEKSFIAIIF